MCYENVESCTFNEVLFNVMMENYVMVNAVHGYMP